MPRLAPVALLLAFAVPAAAQTDATKPVAELAGKYTLVGMTVAGKQLLKAEAEREKFEVRADPKVPTAGTLVAIPADPKREPEPLNFTLDPATAPKAMTFTDPAKKGGPHMMGIYKLEGTKLTIFVAESDKPADRPKDFTPDTAAGSRIITFVLEKQADPKDPKQQ